MQEKTTIDVGIYSNCKTAETHCKKGYIFQKEYGCYPVGLSVCGEVLDLITNLHVDMLSSSEDKKYAALLKALDKFENHCLNLDCNEGVKAAEELEKEARKLIGQKTV